MDIGNDVDDLIRTHTELWHRTSKARIEKDLPAKERLCLFMRTRTLNVIRSITRDRINRELNSGYPDPKMNYKET